MTRQEQAAAEFELVEVYTKFLGNMLAVRRYFMAKHGWSAQKFSRFLKAHDKKILSVQKHQGQSAAYWARERLARLVAGAEAAGQYGHAIAGVRAFMDLEGLGAPPVVAEADGSDRLAPVGAWVPNERRELDAETPTEGEA